MFNIQDLFYIIVTVTKV